MKALLIASGSLAPSPLVEQATREANFIIAIDGGLAHAFRLGLKPDLLLGDLDSLSPANLERAKVENIPTEPYPTEKAYTDTELAFVRAKERGATSIVLLGALGGDRVDHLLANIFLFLQFRSIPWEIRDGNVRIFRLSSGESAELVGGKGDTLSLLPLAGQAEGVMGTGLYYPLDDLTLQAGQAMGMSNVFTEKLVTLSIKKGDVLVLHTALSLS